MENKKIYIFMVLATICWAGAFIAGKYTVPYIPVFTLTFLRFFFAVIPMYIVMRISNHPYRFKKNHLRTFIATGIIGMVGYHILFFSSLKYTTAINSSIIAAMNPIVTIVLAYLFLKQKLSRLQLFGVILSFIGVFLTITDADPDIIMNLTLNKGDLIMFSATVCWAIYGIISSRATQPKQNAEDNITPIALTFYSFVVCLIFLIPFVIYERPHQILPDLSIEVWTAVIYMSIFPSVIGYLIQQLAIKEIGPGRTSVFVNLVPVFSVILAVVILNEILNPIKILTGGLIIFGVIISQRERRNDI
jgi:drug/metabolite transporter (DMT)-like permease